jgi:ABC-type sugar transport system permease subunit
VRHRTFALFILPSAVAMLLFIALPIVSVALQSVHIGHPQVMVEVENCGPFGCTVERRVDVEATAALREEEPLGRFVGLQTYFDRNHLATEQVGTLLTSGQEPMGVLRGLMNLPFYKALAFTLAYTAIVTPFSIVLGFFIAVAVNALPRLVKGPVIFFSLLPMIITPLIGSLILFWMTDARGIIGASLQALVGDPTLSLRASPTLTWLTLFVYGIWSHAPFAFIVFYAGLQTVPSDTLESAMIDGASRWERLRFVVLPHLAPLVTFVSLILIMDNFRVFEPIVGFSAEANATSLSWIIFNDLRGQNVQLFGSAAATSMLTILFVAILLTPVMIRTWREFSRKG